MQTIKPIVFCTIILGILSAAQMNAFARGHEGGANHGSASEKKEKSAAETTCGHYPYSPGC